MQATSSFSLKRVVLALSGVGIAFGALAVLSINDEPRASPSYSELHPTAAAVSPSPPAPIHHYAARMGEFFGYRVGLSDEDRRRGIVTKPLQLFSYQGERQGGYQFISTEGGSVGTAISCTEPCEYVRTFDMTGSHVLPVEPGSIIWEVVDDARNGQLDAGSGAPSIPPNAARRADDPASMPT